MDPPPPKKPKPPTASYQTWPSHNRGKAAKKNKKGKQDDVLHDDKAYHQIAAIASAYQVANPECLSKNMKTKNKELVTELSLIIGSKAFRLKYLTMAKTALKEWKEQGNVPDAALDHLEKHHASVWPSLPFLNRLILQRQQQNASAASASAAPSASTGDPSCQHDEMVPGCSRTATTEQHEVSFTDDLFDENSEMWVDDPEDEVIGSTDDEEEEIQLNVLLDKATLEFMHTTNRTKGTVSWERLMQHWFTHANVALEYIDKMLRWIKKHNAVLTEDQIKKLPTTGRTFLKITKEERNSVHPIPTRNDSGKSIGLYMHYGLMNAIKGSSPGILNWFIRQHVHFITTLN